MALSPNIRITIEHLQAGETPLEGLLRSSGAIAGRDRPARPVKPRPGVGFPPSQALDGKGPPVRTLPYRPGQKPRNVTLPYRPKPGQKLKPRPL